VDPVALAVGHDGRVYVLDSGGPGAGMIIGIDPGDGSQSVVSTGGLIHGNSWRPDMSLSPDGDLIVLDGVLDGITSIDQVFSVNLQTGSQALISASLDLLGGLDTGIGVGTDGTIYVANFSQCQCVARVDPSTGDAQVVFQGYLVELHPFEVAVDANGRLLVTGRGLIRVSIPFSGDSTQLTWLAQSYSDEVEVVPVPEPGAAALITLGLGVLGGISRARTPSPKRRATLAA
jgi:streptogramin lyase